MNAIDTNIWIYMHDDRDARKQSLATELIQRIRPLALPWQVGCEFLAAARKLERFGFTRQQAWDSLEQMRRYADEILLPTEQVWDRAREILERLGLSSWDALLAANCLERRVSTLYSEDFGTLGAIDGMKIINPFA